MNKDINLHLDNKGKKEQELAEYYYKCFHRLKELWEIDEEEASKNEEHFKEMIHLLEEVRFIYRLALVLPYDSLHTTASFIAKVLELMGIDELKEYKDYPFFTDDIDNIYSEEARKNFKLLHVQDDKK